MDITGILDTAAKHGAAYARAQIADGQQHNIIDPLSGEWADDPTPRSVALAAGYEGDDGEDIDAIATAWENGYYDTWEHGA